MPALRRSRSACGKPPGECGALKGQLARRRRGAGIQPHPGDLADELMLAARLAQQRLNPLDRYCADLVAKAARASGHAAGSGPAARASDMTGGPP